MRCKKYVWFGISLALVSVSMGCHSKRVSPQAQGGQQAGGQQQMEGRQNTQGKQGTVVSMMYPISLKHFEQLVESEYPDIDLKVEMTTTAAMNGDSERRLRKGHGTDLVVTTLPTGEVKDHMLDLSAEIFATGYQGSVASPIMIEGQTRYLPLPGQYEGYILNQTFAEQLGSPSPASNAELTELLKAGKEQGKGIGEDGVMFGLTAVSSSSVGTYIIGTRVPDFLGTAKGIKWMSDFNAGTAGFKGQWDNSIGLLTEWADQGYLNAGTLSLKTNNAMPIESRMLDGTLMLAQGNVRMLELLNRGSSQYKFTMLPYLSSEGNAPWVISKPDGYIGINSDLARGGSEGTLDACIRILSLLSTPRGQEAWMEDTSSLSSYLTDFQPLQTAVPDGIADCVDRGYIYDLQMPSNVVQYFGKSMALVLDGKTELGDALDSIDDYCRSGSLEVDYNQSVVGSVEEDLIYENYNTRREETAIGNLIADAVKEYSGAEFAVVNGGGIRASLYQGDVLGEDLNAVCPYPNRIIVVEVKGRVVREMLENGISMTVRGDSVPGGRFLQVSGLCYSYRPMEEERPAQLLSVTLADGSKLDMDTWYTLAVTDYMAGSNGYLNNNGDGYTMLNLYSDTMPKADDIKLLRETGATYGDALRQYFHNHREETIRADLEGRIIASGAGNE